mgnify:CR=1 FL=1
MITLLLIFKILIVILLLVYVIFAGLMMVQIKAMTKAVSMKDDFTIRWIGILHFGFAILVLLMAIFIL